MSLHQVRFAKHGSPESVLALEESALPPLSPSHLRVAVRATPVNPADRLFIEGHYNGLTAAGPLTAGSECAGEIVAVGAEVASHAVGQRVYLSMNFPHTGTWATHVDVDPATALLVPLPDAVAYEEACQLFVNPMTALGFLHDMHKQAVAAEDYVVLTAGNSSLCRMFLRLKQLEKTPGRIICIVRNPKVRDDLLALGAHAVIATQEKEKDLTTQLQDIMGAEGKLRLVFDALGGGPVTSNLIDSLSEGGALCIYGVLDESAITFNVNRLLFKGTQVRGWYLSHYLGEIGFGQVPGKLATILEYLAKGELSFNFRAFDLVKEWKSAVFHCKLGSKSGKAVMCSTEGKP